jgi:dTDP-4-amino-4,6-dideoxygalactose transaminase
MKVPFFPPDIFEKDREFLLDLVHRIGTSGTFILGENVAKLEQRFREATGALDAIAVHSGTGAVAVALRAIGIGPGDEVIVQGFCCQPVASEVINLGATPSFVDVDPQTMVMDAGAIARRITPRTRAILPAHLFADMVDMPTLMDLARRHRIKVVEDACVQQGAVLNGISAGLAGDVGTYSFFQMKVMGGCGEGGMIVTNNLEIARACRIVRNHGQDGNTRFLHHLIGVNSRMDEIMAGFLLHRLDQLGWILERRVEIAEYYHRRFASIADRVALPGNRREGRCYYMYVIRTPRRDALREHLLQRGIGTQVYYPRPLPAQRAFQEFAASEDRLENCARASRENLALPIYPQLTDAQAEVVADAVLEFFA